MFRTINCPFCGKHCSLSSTENFLLKHSNYDLDDYFIRPKYRYYYDYLRTNNRETFTMFLLDYDLYMDNNNIKYYYGVNINNKLLNIEYYELHLYREYFDTCDMSEKFFRIHNEKYINKEDNLLLEADAIRRKNYAIANYMEFTLNNYWYHEYDNRKLSSLYKRMFFIHLINDNFTMEIYDKYLSKLPQRAIILIYIFTGSTQYMINTIVKNNCFFGRIQAFNKYNKDRAEFNFMSKQIGKTFIPTKFLSKQQKKKRKKKIKKQLRNNLINPEEF